MRSRRRESGAASTAVLLLVLLGLIGAGAWNYRRNLELEQASRATRPLAGYSTADLEALADAYRGEVAAHGERYARAKTQRTDSRDRAYFDQQVQEFEKVQRASGRVREVGAELAEREASLRQVEEELAMRGPEQTEWQKHWQRLTKY